ncbi:response regulator transcription factor [Ferrimonas kyonanensis]|uniref:response regulator transcription factor n=1 Tax=Ferrimonas kyonanensis TaxID=364763 RepID=UPI00048722E2|nr:LuxR C-terminal-related transcriptional regulator [Ferrimonas kyonanensis]
MKRGRLRVEEEQTFVTALADFGISSFYYTLFYLPESEDELDMEFANKVDFKTYSPARMLRKSYVLGGDQATLPYIEQYLKRYAEQDKCYHYEASEEFEFYQPRCGERKNQALLKLMASHHVNAEMGTGVLDRVRRGFFGFFFLTSAQQSEPFERSALNRKSEIRCELERFHHQMCGRYFKELNPWFDSGLIPEQALEILRLLSQGYITKEIAELKNLSSRGVDYHLDNLKSCLNARNRIHLTAKAYELGILP